MRQPNPSACPSGSRPATSTRDSHRNASMLRGPGPRAFPPRPLIPVPPMARAFRSLAVSAGRYWCLAVLLMLVLLFLLSGFWCLGFVLLFDQVVRPLIPDLVA